MAPSTAFHMFIYFTYTYVDNKNSLSILYLPSMSLFTACLCVIRIQSRVTVPSVGEVKGQESHHQDSHMGDIFSGENNLF